MWRLAGMHRIPIRIRTDIRPRLRPYWFLRIKQAAEVRTFGATLEPLKFIGKTPEAYKEENND